MTAVSIKRRFLTDVVAFAGKAGLVLLCWIFASAVLELIGLATVVPLLGIVTDSAAPKGLLETISETVFLFLGVGDPLSRLALLLAVFSFLVAVRSWVIVKRDVRFADLQIGFVESLRLRLIERLTAAPWECVLKLRHARITHILTSDMHNVSIAAEVLLRMGFAASLVLAHAALLLLLAPGLAICVLAVMAATPLLFLPMLRKAYIVGVVESRASASLLDTASHFLDGLKLAASQNLQPAFVEEFRAMLDDLRQRQVAFQRQQTRGSLWRVTLASFISALFVFLGFAVFQMPAPVLIVFLLVISRMAPPVVQLQESLEKLARLLPAYGNITALDEELRAIPAVRQVTRGTQKLQGAIVFQNVAYIHGSQDDGGGLHHINIRIEPGEFIGVSGPSGCGKTTFADLLVGLVAPQQGRITVGGTVLDGEALSAWRSHVAYVSQDVFLFHDTVRRNLTWSTPQISEAELWEALTLAGAADLVRRMEHGLNTMIGERGSFISGGGAAKISDRACDPAEAAGSSARRGHKRHRCRRRAAHSRASERTQASSHYHLNCAP